MARMVNNKDDICFLEIGIPTYNRCRQLERLLTILEGEVKSVPDDVSIRITISDNYSSDNTQEILQHHPFRESVLVRINKENVGALRNIWGLYESCRAQYVWIFSDDDIPKPGSLKKIVDGLINYKPTVLTFEFEQPLGSLVKRHGAIEGIEQITDMSQAIPQILVLGKLTKYITNANDLQTVLINEGHLKDTGYGWQAVILEALHLSKFRKITIIHEFLASCDQHYTRLFDELTPQYWDDQLLLLDHEMVRSYCADYAERLRRGHPKYMVMMI
jgi:glycosyltransferase involved in cell wall biosynthesis